MNHIKAEMIEKELRRMIAEHHRLNLALKESLAKAGHTDEMISALAAIAATTEANLGVLKVYLELEDDYEQRN